MKERCSVYDPSAGKVVTPIDAFIEGGTALETPVAEYARVHDTFEVSSAFNRLIPLSTPKAGEQYAFKVDMDRCFGCKACVAACHSLNGLDEDESWRDVGFIHSHERGHSYHQTVTSACHHCVDPACLNGCPVEAYEKDPSTGIVYHLDDQCIGCSYCILKCPYDVPKFNKRLGIVRKCDMCHGRLKEGEAPACAQACPTQAISITIVNRNTVQVDAAKLKFLPGAPSPEYTQPATRYESEREVPATAVAGDQQVSVKQHAHTPLMLMLVLTQFSVGILTALVGSGVESPSGWALAFILSLSGIGASIAHLGRPLRAWRVFLGLGKSWLSREILVFGGYFGLLSLLVVINTLFHASLETTPRYLVDALEWLAVGIGWLGVFTSVMIYADTRRQSWNLFSTSFRFFGTTTISFLFGYAIFTESNLALASLVFVLGSKIVFDGIDSRNCEKSVKGAGRRYPILKSKRGKQWLLARIGFPLMGLLVSVVMQSSLAGITCTILIIVGELCERYQFFVTVNVSKMPGGGVA